MRRRHGQAALLLLAAVAAATVGGAAPPVEFEGFGLGGLEGAGSIAADLRRLEADRERERLVGMPQLAVVSPPAVRGAPPTPLAAELRGRIDAVDVAAGLLADTRMMAEGPARWMGRIGVSSERPDGRDAVELRTVIGTDADRDLVGLELGPRLERRLGGGMTVFLDGRAEAQATRSSSTGLWSLPGSAGERSSMMGVGARTGLAR